MNNILIDDHELQLIAESIIKDFGDLEDIPRELANTIVNIYLRYDLLYSKRGFIPNNKISSDKKNNLAPVMTAFAQTSIQTIAKMKYIKGMIQELRKIDKNSEKVAYEYAIEYMLDILKYNIKDAEKKMGIRRTIERKFKLKKVDEIPNLIDLIEKKIQKVPKSR
jgi:hypothetical protein